MTYLNRIVCSLVMVGCAGWISTASAAALSGMNDSYADMCMKMANMPAPYGEYDLKGNPKLPQYCACFSGLFAARAKAAASGARTNATLEENVAGERAMRSTCRAQLKLPPIKRKPEAVVSKSR